MEELPPPEFNLPPVNKSRKNILSVLLLLFLVLAVGIGVYLTLNPTNFLPQALTPLPFQPQTSLNLEKSPTQVAKDELAVDVVVRSDIDPTNLVATKIKFPSDSLEVKSIATGSAKVKWIKENFDNSLGEINLDAGIPNPGLKTNSQSSTNKLTLTTIVFKTKKAQKVDLSLDHNSLILRNSDNINILKIKKGLSLDLTSFAISSQSSPSASLTNLTDMIKVASPNGGEVYSYYNPINITWTTNVSNKTLADRDKSNISKVSISLYLNNKFFGKLATNIDNTGKFSWSPSQTLSLLYINSDSVYKVEVAGMNKSGQTASDLSDGPFSIASQTDAILIASSSGQLEQTKGDLNGDNAVNLTDLSILLSNFNKSKFLPQADLNGDGVVNEIDLWLLKSLLTGQDLLKL